MTARAVIICYAVEKNINSGGAYYYFKLQLQE